MSFKVSQGERKNDARMGSDGRTSVKSKPVPSIKMSKTYSRPSFLFFCLFFYPREQKKLQAVLYKQLRALMVKTKSSDDL